MKAIDVVDALIAYMRSAESTIESSTASTGQRRAALIKAFDQYVDARIDAYIKSSAQRQAERVKRVKS